MNGVHAEQISSSGTGKLREFSIRLFRDVVAVVTSLSAMLDLVMICCCGRMRFFKWVIL